MSDRAGAAFSRALVVANPIAGRGKGLVVAGAVAAALHRRGIVTDLHVSAGRGDCSAGVARAARDVDVVVAVGGDGTLREVLEGLPDPLLPVGIVPVGTANVLSRDLGLPRDVEAAVGVVAAGRTRPIDVGRTNGALTMLVAGIGLDALVVRDVARRRRGPITKWSYVKALARTLRAYHPPRLGVEIDGVRRASTFGLVLIANVVHYAGWLHLSPAREIADGRFEVYVFGDAAPLRLVAVAARGLLATIDERACDGLHRARTVRVTSETPAPYQVDGEAAGETPVEFAVEPLQYRIVVP
ncbi:MAG: YegS/Rv2252/BmrU family lipid kinase [Candidatus Rokubacteria bacterium]|nr:YegS/Rv2252/BmrU family lipid kinase [Candidatus Rokubacteria bacterium]